MAVIAGLDIGTTGCKAVLYDEKGSHLCTCYEEYGAAARVGAHELSAEALWKSVVSVLCGVSRAAAPDVLGVTSLGETFVMLDGEDRPAAPVMLYTDPRGEAEARELEARVGAEVIMARTGVRANAMYSLPKVMWIKKHMPEAYKKTKRILLIQDYVIYRLTGCAQIDFSLAARTMAFNVVRKCWDPELFEAADVERSLFSQAVPSGTAAGRLKAEFAREWGTGRFLVVNGCHDQVAAVTGAGVFEAGEAMDGSGTVECIPIILDGLPDRPELCAGGYSFVPHAIPGKYVCYALSFAGGAALKWFKDTFGQKEQELAEAAGQSYYAFMDERVGAAPTGILTLPYFSGAATPYMDHHATGAMLGLTFSHRNEDLYRAIMEGVAYEMRVNLEQIASCGFQPKRMRASGGGAASDVWLQIKADVFGVPIEALEAGEIGAMGTAVLAGRALGIYRDIREQSRAMARVRKTFYPQAQFRRQYDACFCQYKKIYRLTKEVFDRA